MSDYCIGATGAVQTVCLYGDVPVEEMTSIYLDHHSRTSAALIRILLQRYWKHEVNFLPADDGYIDQIGGTTGGLVIGDRTIDLEKQFSYVYDLGEAWTDFTSLPFVFAAWVSRRPLDPAFVEAFNDGLRKGIEAIPQLKLLLPSPSPDFDLQAYFTRYISYELDDGKRAGLALYLQYLAELPQLASSVNLKAS